MKDIIAFAGSNSSASINHQLLAYAKKQIDNGETNVNLIRLTDFDIPMFSIDIEQNDGIPGGVKQLDAKIQSAGAVIISVAEHNGNISAFFKNIIDWLSRHNRHFLDGKKILLLSTSPGKGGATSALEITNKTLPYFKGEVMGKISIGSFYDVLKEGKIADEKIKKDLESLFKELVKSV